ncbi:DinB family protein [Aureisphaera galaxeae]|uniref:DinB family protein n=1 Tax=Aureisphaera galaxeae TaxID=1538023 RepID=UPI002350FC07|nr:DinB family protein [Aureisphaera galaxeae]MDC8002907.1 DinB family protein [Aureisphaera galaxeae]
MRTIQKPKVGEYPAYSSIYMDLLEDDGNVLNHLWNNFLRIKEYIYALPEAMLTYRYAPKKWTIKEILVHIIDDERIFSYRALRYARNDQTPLHGFEQDDYAEHSEANERSLDSIFDEYETVRKATISLFKYLPEDSFMRSGNGIDSDGSVVNERTVRGLAYHIAGHELRHFNIIKERYVNEA